MLYHALSHGGQHSGRLFLLLAAAVLFSGCLRYVPSRTEIIEESRRNPTSSAKSMGGPEQFWNYEKRMTQRLEDLLRARARLVQTSEAAAYRLGPGDVIELQVYGLNELSTTAEIGPDGSFNVPLVGPLNAKGLTLPELREELNRALTPYVRSPRAVVSLKEFANRVSVVGAVMKPGTYPLRSHGTSLTEVLSLAGGRTDRAGSRVILLPAVRDAAETGSDPQYGVEVDAAQLLGTVDEAPLAVPLAAGDTIVVPEAGTFKVDGEVNRGGSFPLTGRTSALGAIAAAGGFTYSANAKEVEVIRDVGNGKKASIILDLDQVALNGEQDVVLRDGDVVRVPSDPGPFRTRQFVEGVQGFFRGAVSASVRTQ